VKIPAETLKQRTILFKLILMLVNLFRSVSDTSRKRCYSKMQNANNREVLGNGPDFLASSYTGLEKLFHLKGAKYVEANQAEPGTESHGRPGVDDRRSTVRCGWNHWMQGHFAPQEWPHRRRPLRSQLAGQGRIFQNESNTLDQFIKEKNHVKYAGQSSTQPSARQGPNATRA
jgi:hypothetical protein